MASMTAVPEHGPAGAHEDPAAAGDEADERSGLLGGSSARRGSTGSTVSLRRHEPARLAGFLGFASGMGALLAGAPRFLLLFLLPLHRRADAPPAQSLAFSAFQLSLRGSRRSPTRPKLSSRLCGKRCTSPRVSLRSRAFSSRRCCPGEGLGPRQGRRHVSALACSRGLEEGRANSSRGSGSWGSRETSRSLVRQALR